MQYHAELDKTEYIWSLQHFRGSTPISFSKLPRGIALYESKRAVILASHGEWYSARIFVRPLRLLVRATRTGGYTARLLRDEYAQTVTVRRVQQLLHDGPSVQWVRSCVVPFLTERNPEKRLTWACSLLVPGERWWREVVLSDELRFNLDGPDGLSAPWEDVRRPVCRFGSRQQGGASVIVKAEFRGADVPSSALCRTLWTIQRTEPS